MTATNMAVYMAERRKNRRNQLIEMSGGKCIKCGSTDDLNFDHIDPQQRSFRLCGKALDGPWGKILEEWRKCQLLCRKCHLHKTEENDEYGEPANKGIDKYGNLIPEHGHSARYAAGCRCELCAKARYESRIQTGEISGKRGFYGPRTSTDPIDRIKHGTRSGYQKEKRLGLQVCEECRKANCEATMDRKRKKKLMACGEKVSFSAVTGTLPVRVGLGQPVQESLFE